MVEVSTSILGVKKEDIINTIYNLETAKTDYFHIDVMDGEFVENNTVEKMMEYCDYLKNITNVPLDVHLMVKEPKKYVDLFLPYSPKLITIHYEVFPNKNEVLRMINYIKSNNCMVGLAIKPGTEVSEVIDLLEFVHCVLIMTVEPGRGGQKLIGFTLEKIKELSDYIKANNMDIIIEADGGINTDNVEKLKQAGAEVLVSGTGIIKQKDWNEVIKFMKQ